MRRRIGSHRNPVKPCPVSPPTLASFLSPDARNASPNGATEPKQTQFWLRFDKQTQVTKWHTRACNPLSIKPIQNC
jgi:hypothetical protein